MEKGVAHFKPSVDASAFKGICSLRRTRRQDCVHKHQHYLMWAQRDTTTIIKPQYVSIALEAGHSTTKVLKTRYRTNILDRHIKLDLSVFNLESAASWKELCLGGNGILHRTYILSCSSRLGDYRRLTDARLERSQASLASPSFPSKIRHLRLLQSLKIDYSHHLDMRELERERGAYPYIIGNLERQR